MGKEEKGKGPAEAKRFTLARIAGQEGTRNVVEHTTDHHKIALENSHVTSPPCLVESDIEVFCEREKVSKFNGTYFKKYSKTLVELFLEHILPNLNNIYDRNKKELTEADWTAVEDQLSALFNNLSLTVLSREKTTPSKTLKEWRENLKKLNNETIANICISACVELTKNNKLIKPLSKIYAEYKTKKQKPISDKEFNHRENQYYLFLSENEIRDNQLKHLHPEKEIRVKQLKLLHRYIVGIVQNLQKFKSKKGLQIYPQCKNLNTGWYTTQFLKSTFEDLKQRVVSNEIQELDILKELNTIFTDYINSLELTAQDKINAIASISQYGLLDICREVAWQLGVNDFSNFAGANLFEHFKERYKNTVFNLDEYKMLVRRLKNLLPQKSALQDASLRELNIDFAIEESFAEITLRDVCVDVAFELGCKNQSNAVGENLLKQFNDLYKDTVFNLDEYKILVDNLKNLLFSLNGCLQVATMEVSLKGLGFDFTKKAGRYIEILLRRRPSDSSTQKITRKLSVAISTPIPTHHSQDPSPSSSSSHSYERTPPLPFLSDSPPPPIFKKSLTYVTLAENANTSLPYLNLSSPREKRGRSQSANGNTIATAQRQTSFRILELTPPEEKRQRSKSLTGKNEVKKDVFRTENSAITPPTPRTPR